MADVTITIDGQTTHLVTSIKKADSALKMMGATAEQTGRKIEQAGDKTAKSFEKSIISVGKIVAGARAIARGFNAAGQEISAFQDKLASMSEKKGDVALRVGRATAAGGLNKTLVDSFMAQQGGVASPEDKAGLIEDIAKADLNLTPQEFIAGTTALNSGAYDRSGVMENLKNGEGFDVQGRLRSFNPGQLRELDTRRYIESKRINDLGLEGDFQRMGKADIENQDLRNPVTGFLRKILEDYTPIGAVGAMSAKSRAAERAQEREEAMLNGMLRAAAAAEKTANSRRLNVDQNVKD